MMDKKPDKECKVEYVDAEPIEGTGSPAPHDRPWAGDGSPASQGQRGPGGSAGQPNVYTYYHKSQGCGPCCGPIGCGVMLAMVLLVLGQPELLKGVLYALAIFVVVSFLSQVFLRRG